jgi:transcriptional regulator with GAF, ATPase, and Fis domain/tetratricopeptide (TPR) repeat protein
LDNKSELSEAEVVDLARARVKLRSRQTSVSSEAHTKELAAVNLLLDQGHSVEARTRLATLISDCRNDPVMLANARLALSVAIEMHGDYQKSLQSLAMYEADGTAAKLPADVALKLRVQIAIGQNYCGDHPRAVASLKAALKELSDEQAAPVYTALARIYRSINESSIARDYSQRALHVYRQSGDWRGLAEGYFGMALADLREGLNESALENFTHALTLIGDHPATFLLGKVYSNMAGVCWRMKRPKDGIAYLEKAIEYYEHSDHHMMAAIAYNNLGLNLMLVGQWDRAHESYNRSLSLITEIDPKDEKVPMALDSLGELCLFRGELEEARNYLERAVALAQESGNKWHIAQTLRTMARCYIATDEPELAFARAQQALDTAHEIADGNSIWESQLLLAESYLRLRDLASCAAKLSELSEQTSDSPSAIGLSGETHRLQGLLAMAKSDAASATQHFGSCISMFELLGDRYRTGRAHFDLGRSYMLAQSELASEHLTRAVNIFRELGARGALAVAQAACEEWDRTPRQQERKREAAVQLITLRLAEAVASRALLLRELAAVIRQETSAKQVMVLEPDEEQKQRIVVAHGFDDDDDAATRIADEFAATDAAARQSFARRRNVKLITLKSSNSLPATLLISPAECAVLPNGMQLDPLLRVVELGMDVCALRSRTSTDAGAEQEEGSGGSGLMTGFIHSSPAMTRLVEEVNKIRSSDVTVLVTGESGTGKELVARAIHALSARRDKVFVPFNCTAVPKELSESYLFGHRRGAFTGAVNDSSGVIRASAGGTLFIDEVGDLPLDVQPKLLRFLQEGEIQPLGEQKPIKIDVRIIAATNTDLEDLVAQGKFREDLYYRLNVIRLRVPPLRERRSEIPTIVNYYINHYSSKFGRHDIQITPQAVDLLMVADWPGNVRQLCNEVQRIVARAENGNVITPEQLSPELRQMGVPTIPTSSVNVLGTTPTGRSEVVPIENISLAEALEEVERRMITDAMRRHKGNISRVARELGLTRRGLYLKLDRYNLKEREGTND